MTPGTGGNERKRRGTRMRVLPCTWIHICRPLLYMVVGRASGVEFSFGLRFMVR